MRARRSKNSGGGITPTAFGALIEAVFCSVNDFPTRKIAANAPRALGKLLEQLNLSVRASIAGETSSEGIRMIRGFFRLIGLLLLAAGFVFLVYDGARSIADQALRLTKLGEFWNDINQASQRSFLAMIDADAPWLRGGVKLLLDQPSWAVMGILGILLMLLCRPRRPLIGYSRN